jgi:hypothetical protein
MLEEDGSFKGGNMTSKIAVAIFLVAAVPLVAEGGKKKPAERAMLEKMEAVPCGAKQKGIAGLGSLWASVGITKMNSDEKLCPEYLLRTDDMDYHIRPADYKHPTVLRSVAKSSSRSRKIGCWSECPMETVRSAPTRWSP